MAIWQYKIDYFEKLSTEQKFPHIPTSLNHDDWYNISEDFEFSLRIQARLTLLVLLSKLLLKKLELKVSNHGALI